jgi:hypothetical protein
VASLISWESEYVAQSADEALRAAEVGEGREGASAKNQAVEFLKSILPVNIPVSVCEIERDAVDARLHQSGKPIGQNKPIRDARKALGVITKKAGFGGVGWVWVLPNPPLVPTDTIGARSQGWAPMDPEGTYGPAEGGK